MGIELAGLEQALSEAERQTGRSIEATRDATSLIFKAFAQYDGICAPLRFGTLRVFVLFC
jgi:hypothetical protein